MARIFYLIALSVAIHSFLCLTVGASDYSLNSGCGILCRNDSDCSYGDLFRNPCAMCGRSGTCEQVCGTGCRQDSDCRPLGEGNPCTTCNLQKRLCVNPQPLCGSFCGNDPSACLVNGTGDCASGGGAKGCCSCTVNGCASPPNPGPQCGTVCSTSSQCTTNSECPQCIAYGCAPAQNCGQVCVSSGECQNNAKGCQSCRFNSCQKGGACGASCSQDDDCDQSSCPVCGNIATCVGGEEYKAELSLLPVEARQITLLRGKRMREEVAKKQKQLTELI
jgi:hypothetical protein